MKIFYSTNDIKIEKINSTNYFIRGVNEKLGTLSKSNNKYYIQEVKNEHHFLQNLYPLANCKYVINGKGYSYTVETNSYGQKVQIKAKIGGTQWTKPGKTKRKQKIISGSRDAMRNINADGNNVSVFSNLHDEGGHMIPRLWLDSPVDVSLNIVPQDYSLNHNPEWDRLESSGLNALVEGKIVELTIKFQYVGKYLRPQIIHRYQTEDGQVVCDKPFENLP